MPRFNPNMLIPASAIEGAAKGTPARTIQQIALDNIDRMRGEWKDKEAGKETEGRKNWRVVGDKVLFTVRISNSALVLERVKVNDTEVEVREMSAPQTVFDEALTYYADRIKAGEYAPQLEAVNARKQARSEKRQANKAAKAAPTK